jgi:hypothetical protein
MMAQPAARWQYPAARHGTFTVTSSPYHQGRITLISPPGARGDSGGKLALFCTIALRPTPLGLRPIRPCRGLASFCTTDPLRRLGILARPPPNWLCSARLASPEAPSPGCPILPKFGFVLPKSYACPIHHNSFSIKDLSLASRRCTLGLFVHTARAGAGWQPQAGRSRCHSFFNPQSAVGELALFGAFDRSRVGSSLWNRRADQSTISPFPSTTCHRIGFVSRSGASRRCRTIGSSPCWTSKLALFCAIDPGMAHGPILAASPPIGFVSRSGASRRCRRIGPSARLALFCIVDCPDPSRVSRNWLCFAEVYRMFHSP